MKRVFVLLALLALAACGSSPPTHFYTLSAVPGQRVTPAAHAAPIQVGRVTIPDSLDRLAFVTQSGPNQLNVSDQDRWGAPMEGMVRQVLASDLSQRLGSRMVVQPGEPAPPGGVRELVVNIRRFIGDATGNVELQADWAIVAGKSSKAQMERQESIRVAAGSGQAGPIAAAMSQALGQLSDHVAAALAGGA